jgi:glutamate-5-semialdehyde dehydrogenase
MQDYNHIFEKVKDASAHLTLVDDEQVNAVLNALADAAEEGTQYILKANRQDLERMPETDPKYDRLKLTEKRIGDIAGDLRNVARLNSPLHRVLSERQLPNGLALKKVSVPLGVVGIIYEARPNVTFDVFSLCLKSGNACVLKGGSDAEHSNRAIAGIIRSTLEKHGLSADILQLLPPDRSATAALLEATGFVDIIIPRGSQALIDYVRDNAKVPVIETGAGIVHTYFDKSGDLEKGKAIVNNAKTRRVSVCNALDCLVVHEQRLGDLAALTAALEASEVEIFADEAAYAALEGHYPKPLLKKAGEEHFGIEFLDYKMSIKTVDGLQEAMTHIARFSSRHSEAIIAEDEKTIDHFLRAVDAATVYANSSTAFTDGAQFGLGAEIGISTQKLHARGPMALEELTSYKWIVRGNGQIRA